MKLNIRAEGLFKKQNMRWQSVVHGIWCVQENGSRSRGTRGRSAISRPHWCESGCLVFVMSAFNPGDDDWQDEDWYAPNTSLRRDTASVCKISHILFLHRIIWWVEFYKEQYLTSSNAACCEVRRWRVGWWRWWMGWMGWMGWRMVSLVWCTRCHVDLYGAACKATCTIRKDEVLFNVWPLLVLNPKGESTVGKKQVPFEAETMYSRAKPASVDAKQLGTWTHTCIMYLHGCFTVLKYIGTYWDILRHCTSQTSAFASWRLELLSRSDLATVA